MLVRSAPDGVLSKICKSPSAVELFFSPLYYGERESLRATPLNMIGWGSGPTSVVPLSPKRYYVVLIL